MLVKSALHTLFSRMHGQDFSVRWWDGSHHDYGRNQPRFILYFRHEPAFNHEDPMVTLGEAYMDDAFDIEGDWDALLAFINANRDVLDGPLARVTGVARTLDRLRLRTRQKQNIASHYDLGNDFYSLWLDPSLSYSCAYFTRPDMSLEDAQCAKLDHVLNKLCLQQGEHLLDIGCGWGALLIRAAERFGISGVGLTLSEEQAAGARSRIEAAGLADRIEIRLMDYLDLDGRAEQFDKIASVGMFEHVGDARAALFMRHAYDVLAPGGLMLLHTIVSHTDGGTNRWVEKYIFPGGEVPYQPRLLTRLAEAGFFLLQQESLRLHYAATLDCWYRNFQAVLDVVRAQFDPRFVRMWTLYLRGCAASFRAGGLDVSQLLLSRGLTAHPPRHYAHLYTGEAPARW